MIIFFLIVEYLLKKSIKNCIMTKNNWGVGEHTDFCRWFETLYEQYSGKLIAYLTVYVWKGQGLLKSEIEDCVQEVFITAWEKRRELYVHPNIGGWLVKTAFFKMDNRIMAHQRKKKVVAVSLEQPIGDSGHALGEILCCPDMENQDKEMDETLLEAIRHKVSVEEYKLLWAYYNPRSDKGKIKSTLNLSDSGLKMKVKRIVDRLKKSEFFVFFLMFM